MHETGITVSQADGVATIEMTREPHNFFDFAMIAHLADTIEACDGDPAVRACLLISGLKSFCAGADFSGGKRPDPGPIYESATRLAGRRKPLIAAIGGAAVGGGLGLALAADMRVGSHTAWFQANFVRIGLSPGFGLSHTLPLTVGPHRARELFFSGRRIEAQEALALGLLDRLVEPEQLREAANELASEVAATSPTAFVATRQLLDGDARADFAAAVARELAAQRPLFAGSDFSEGVAATRERRTPVFADLKESAT
jgi:2-(1,2-epoxy-1,2-dihydrophenyl)acetyl-CoA isomerase